MRVLGKDEGELLAQHVRTRSEQLRKCMAREENQPTSKADGCLPEDTLDGWINHRFEAPLKENAKEGPRYRSLFTTLSVFAIVAGLGSSALANVSGTWPQWAVVILGLVVSVSTGINQILNPAQRSVVGYQAAYALRREGWDFVQDRGRYEKLHVRNKLGVFIDEVNRIHRGAESIDESAPVNQTVEGT